MTSHNKLSTKDLIKMHQFPSKQFHLPGTKNLIPSNTEEEHNEISQYLQLMKTHLQEIRVHRRKQRSLAIWLPDKLVIQITKLVGKIFPQFGFMENQELFLSQEESLFLMEMNKLEIFWNQVPFSIEQAYSVFCNTEEKLSKYRTFKELANNGYRLKNQNQSRKHSYAESSSNRNSLEYDNDNSKKLKIDPFLNKEFDENEKLLNRLKENGPLTFNLEKNNAMFQMYLPQNKNIHSEIGICTKNANDNEFSNETVSQDASCILTAFSGNETIAMYQFHKVDFENK